LNYGDEYRRKLVSADEAVKVIKSGDWIDYGPLCGQVIALDQALVKRKDELEDIKIWSQCSFYLPEIFRVDPRGETFIWNTWHLSAQDRRVAAGGRPVYYAPMRYSELPRFVREHIKTIDVAMMQVAPMDNHGFFNFGPQTSHCKALCDTAKILILEVNKNQPRCLGGYEESIHISQVDYIVEGENPPLPQLAESPPTEVDRKAAGHILEEMRDGCCLQLGIGGMPNAVGKMIAESELKDMGCHSEMLVDAFVDMYEAGRLSGSKKQIDPEKLVYTFAVGSQRLYDFINDNPLCASYPVNYTNNIAIASRNDNLISINNAIEVDLYGQVCSESTGTRIISGTGGQLDFVLAAYESRGGKSFICLPSTKSEGNGEIKSTIVPTLTPGAIVTDPRTVAHFIVSEYGKCELKGKTVWQRAEGLINIAHPDFRDQLIKDAEVQGIWRRTNRL